MRTSRPCRNRGQGHAEEQEKNDCGGNSGLSDRAEHQENAAHPDDVAVGQAAVIGLFMVHVQSRAPLALFDDIASVLLFNESVLHADAFCSGQTDVRAVVAADGIDLFEDGELRPMCRPLITLTFAETSASSTRLMNTPMHPPSRKSPARADQMLVAEMEWNKVRRRAAERAPCQTVEDPIARTDDDPAAGAHGSAEDRPAQGNGKGHAQEALNPPRSATNFPRTENTVFPRAAPAAPPMIPAAAPYPPS